MTYTLSSHCSDSCLSNNQRRIDLAAAYHMLALLNMDDLTYTHLSVRSLEGNSFYIYPFGYLFDEVTASCLLKVNFDGVILEGHKEQYNQTGFTIHSQIYRQRPDLQAIFHFHTPATVAVSTHPQGLLPISQWALHFYQQMAYHAYDAHIVDDHQGQQLVDDLADKHVMMMRYHGVLTCGATLPEAFFYAYHLQQACRAQCLILGQNADVPLLSPSICEKAVSNLLNFEKNLGQRDWNAMLRKLTRLNRHYDDLV